MSDPALSAILVTLDDWTNMRNTLRALRAQTVRSQIELVLVGPSLDALHTPDEEVEGFAALRTVPFGRVSRLGEAIVQGVRGATAPLVALTEDHCYPESRWAESFIRRHATGTWAGVGPTVANANPATIASWTQFIIEYGPYSDAGKAGPCRQIPGHNSCYRRDALLAYEPDLADWLECETLMHWDMTDRGQVLFLDDEVRTCHWNCSRLSAVLSFAWLFSREFAAYRARRMTPLQRAKFALLWPLIPAIRLKRLWPNLTSLVGRRRAAAALPAVVLNLVVSGAAEGLGYLSGRPGAPGKCLDWEFHRERFLRRGEVLGARDPSHSDAPRLGIELVSTESR